MKFLWTLLLFTSLFVFSCKKPSTTYNIHLVTMDGTEDFWHHIDEGCKKAKDELKNVNYKWNAPQFKTDDQQIRCIREAVKEGANAILLAANNPGTITEVLQEASSKGIKIVYVDSPATFKGEAIFGTDNYKAGQQAGNEMLNALRDRGILEGKVGVISSSSPTESTTQRQRGFLDVMESHGFHVMEVQYMNNDLDLSITASYKLILQGAVGLFGANETSTVAAGNAIKQSGENIVCVGFDNNDAITSLIKENKILCTIIQNPELMGYEGVIAAVKALDGIKTEPYFIDTGCKVLTIKDL